jgi:hypothetical protein
MAATLNWVDAGTEEVLDPGLVLEGKQVILRDTWTGGKKPVELRIREEEGWLGGILRALKGIQPNASNHPASEVPPGGQVSRATWRTKVGSLEIMQTTWLFSDKANRALSGPLMVTASHGGALIVNETERGGPIPIEVEAGHPLAKVRVKTVVPVFDKTRKKILRYVSVTDPSISCRVLVPWQDGPSGLLDFIHNREPKIPMDGLRAEFVRAFGSGILTRPKELEVSIEDPNFDVAEGGSHDVVLTISAGPESETVVAVLAIIDGNPSQTVLSELIQIGVVPISALATEVIGGH